MTKKLNPAPLGLLGFGLTTILLNIHNAGIISLNITIIAMGIALGGLAQIIAGILEFKLNNNFGGTAFTAYGLFWISLVLIWTNEYEMVAADKTSMGFYLLLWGIFTAFMFIGTLKHNTNSKITFGTLMVLFFLLAIGDFANSAVVTQIAGYVGIFGGASALYGTVAQILNEEYGKVVLPL